MELPNFLVNQRLNGVKRRGKYLLFEFDSGTMIVHLGMSGHLRVVTPKTALTPHDHIDFEFEKDRVLRFNDPRRFGSVHWCHDDAFAHPLLRDLGPEPLDDAFTGHYLHQISRRKTVAVKNFIMNSHIVVGVGNIYANESLFKAGIRPTVRAGRISRMRYDALVVAIKRTLNDAIDVGGTTLRDFVGFNGEPGYFGIQLDVYGRSNEPCVNCQTALRGIVVGQRQTVYCPICQKP